jgi:uncharacterized protein (UPF0332 family)
MNQPVHGLLDKAFSSLNAAILLYSEKYTDFATSRAYYAMFYAAEALLLSKGLSFSSHSAVTAAFGKEFAKTGLIPVKFHRDLLDVERLRNVGDYDVGPSITPEKASEVLQRAAEFLQTVQEYLSRE